MSRLKKPDKGFIICPDCDGRGEEIGISHRFDCPTCDGECQLTIEENKRLEAIRKSIEEEQKVRKYIIDEVFALNREEIQTIYDMVKNAKERIKDLNI